MQGITVPVWFQLYMSFQLRVLNIASYIDFGLKYRGLGIILGRPEVLKVLSVLKSKVQKL